LIILILFKMDKKKEHLTNQKNIVEYKKMGRSSSKLKALIKKI
jgi:hypothetical protein